MDDTATLIDNTEFDSIEPPLIPSSVELDTTFTHCIENFGFGDLPIDETIEIYKDGRVFSHFIEKWMAKHFPLTHVGGCKKYDFVDNTYPDTKYDEKTFTKGGCNFCPSNMLGQGRKFDEAIFREKTIGMIFAIVSNIQFPRIKIKFMRGANLIKMYPKGHIPLKDHDKFFN
jgi:hypothetical protein